jgi:hypothetical protein
VNEPVAEIHFTGDVEVSAFRRGTYLARGHLDTLIERALGRHYRFGEGWSGFGVVSISLYDSPPAGDENDGAARKQEQVETGSR